MHATQAGFTFGIARRLYCGFSLIVAILLVLLTVSYTNFSKL
jgi:CHASE3 domain sensor protein